MGNRKVFILGAGASSEVRLPLGSKLKILISKHLSLPDISSGYSFGENSIIDALGIYNKGVDIQNLVKSANLIRNGLPTAASIDNFIDNHRDNPGIVLCGKLAITLSILNSEMNSDLYLESTSTDPNHFFSKLSKTWYISFMHYLTAGCKKEELASRFQQLTFIIFNYDRCFEHFLYNSLKFSYDLSDIDIKKLFGYLKIFHPYGKVGELPFMGNKQNSVDYGGKLKPPQLLEYSSNIKTYTEKVNKYSNEMSNMLFCLRKADIITFLGFGYHSSNLELLKQTPNEVVNKPINCYGTSVGISDYDRKIYEMKITQLFNSTKPKSVLKDLSCYDLMNHYSTVFSF